MIFAMSTTWSKDGKSVYLKVHIIYIVIYNSLEPLHEFQLGGDIK